jgi:hypothetical protein
LAQAQDCVQLTKSLNSLDDLYCSYLASKVDLSTSGSESGATAVRAYRDAIQYEFIDDTLWVKVFITTARSSAATALERLKSMNLRSLSQFGNIFAARIDLQQLPALDGLSFVQRIEPVAPDGYSARATVEQTTPEISVKKK